MDFETGGVPPLQNYDIFGRQYPKQYDAIVVGAGIGGLFCANLLAREGLKVLLLERHYMLGGFCSTFRRKNFVFDAATHFYPLLGNPATLTGKLLRDLEVPTEWVKMDPVDQFHLPGLPPFAVPADFEEYVRKLKAWFPSESVSLDAYLAETRQAYLHGLLYYFKGVTSEKAERLCHFTVAEKLDQHFRDRRLKTLLMADAPHWGSLPHRTSFLFDAMLRHAYFLGNYYPKGGSQRFADDLSKTLERRGGKVLRCAEALRILVEKGKASGVLIRTLSRRLSEEFAFKAPIVVSNADALHTFRNLIGQDICGKECIQAMEKMSPSYPCFLVHIGLEGMEPQRLAAAEGYYWSSDDPEDAARNVFKIFVPTHFDPNVAPRGCQILIVQKLTPVRLEEVDDWDTYRNQIHCSIMQRLRKILPGIDSHIVVNLAASAMTSCRFTNNWQGAMLGWEMTPGQLGSGRLPNTTPVESLYLVGHWTQPGGGVTPVIISAQRVANMILRGTEKRAEPVGDHFAATL